MTATTTGAWSRWNLDRLDRLRTNADAAFGGRVALATLAFLVFVGVLYPTPPAVLVLGAVIGSLNALIAMGIVLVYRANRIVNFAAGDLGGVAAMLGVSLVAAAGWGFLPAFGAGLLAALALGAALEFLVIRRFASSPRLILTVATIALVFFPLGFLQLFLPTLFGYDTAPQDFPEPFPFSFTWSPLVFRSSHLLVVIAVPLVAAGLAAFFRYTRVGIAVRASAESADRASLLGVPVKRVGTLVWVIAAGLSAVAVLLRAPIFGATIGTVLGPALLLRALAAAVIAGMERLPVAFGAAVVLGVVEQAVLWGTGRTLVADAILFGVILIGLLFRRPGAVDRADDSGVTTWKAAAEVRPVLPHVRRLPLVRWGTKGLAGVALVLLVALPITWSPSQVSLFSAGLVFAIVCLSLVVLTGWAGQVSLGQMAFAGFGSAVAGTLSLHGWHFFLCLLAAGVTGALVAVLIGLPALRIRGPFLAVATLGFALSSGAVFLNPEFVPWLVPGAYDRITRPVLFGKFDLESELAFYYVVLVALALVLGSVTAVRRSRTGRTLVAVRENARAAQSYGVSPVRATITAFAMSGFVAAFAGGLFVFHQHAMASSVLRVESSIQVFTVTVIGGVGSVAGGLIGAAYFTFLNYSPLTRVEATRLLGSGLGVLVVLLFLPNGLSGLAYRLRDRVLDAIVRRSKEDDE